ncbi:alpha/beta hydrolase [Bacillus sp. CGMCC 1.16607]|uniref:alpha/beta hydrolase n=1 Tax=Bacillus sp. CGMCC 1.16607 TaxID=3351842 RepID=UPI0036272724
MEKEIMIQSKVVLKGTLSIPKHCQGKAPAVLIIPGTGKLDRNGRVNTKIDLKLYRQLSEFLTSIGFVTLRYDKRGVGESEGNYITTGLWDLVDDAIAAVHFLKEQPEVDSKKVIVLGHSEGAALGTAVAARENLGGLILLAGAVERLTEALARQRELARIDVINGKGFQASLLRFMGVQNKLEKQAQKYLDKVLKTDKDSIRIGLFPTNAKWMREHYAYNVREDLEKVTCPILAITGSRDIQANPDVLKDLPKYVTEVDAQFKVIEDMNHSLKYQANFSSIFSAKKDIIADCESPVHPELVRSLENWLQTYLRTEIAV